MSAWQKAAYPEEKDALYRVLAEQLAALMEGERDRIANLANMSALLYQALPDVNWAGFYLFREGMLILGPFQGNPACIRIPLGRGVCGAAAQSLEVQRVEDVHLFPGHIACDAQSRSEIVIPLVQEGRLLGVLDLDSPSASRFDAEDQRGLEQLCALLVRGCSWQ